MRMVSDGRKYPDVVVSADAGLLRDRLYDTHTTWDVSIASNAVGIAYASDTRFGERLEAGDPWYEVARDADPGALAISDPDLDPSDTVPSTRFDWQSGNTDSTASPRPSPTPAYREPQEPQLLAGVETGNRAAAVVYRNMAADHGLPFHPFPEAYDFSNPEYADRYAEASYTTDGGTRRPVRRSCTTRRPSRAQIHRTPDASSSGSSRTPAISSARTGSRRRDSRGLTATFPPR